MKKASIISLVIICTTLLSSFNVISVYANSIESNSSDESIGDPSKGEVTEYKYMYIDDVLYKRLWSVTRHCWIDPYWIPA